MENNNKYPPYDAGQYNSNKSEPVKDQDLSPSFETQEKLNSNSALSSKPQSTMDNKESFRLAYSGPVMGTVTNDSVPNSNIDYAPLGSRALANFVDGIIIGIIYLPFMLPNLISQLKNSSIIGVSETYGTMGVSQTTVPSVNPIYSLLSVLGYIITIAYPIYFIGKNGATPGKKVLKIKVIDKNTGKTPGYLKAFLREFVGKFISSVVLSLGYLWAVWDKEKQGWHDKIAGTVVISTNEHQ